MERRPKMNTFEAIKDLILPFVNFVYCNERKNRVEIHTSGLMNVLRMYSVIKRADKKSEQELRHANSRFRKLRWTKSMRDERKENILNSYRALLVNLPPFLDQNEKMSNQSDSVSFNRILHEQLASTYRTQVKFLLNHFKNILSRKLW